MKPQFSLLLVMIVLTGVASVGAALGQASTGTAVVVLVAINGGVLYVGYIWFVLMLDNPRHHVTQSLQKTLIFLAVAGAAITGFACAMLFAFR